MTGDAVNSSLPRLHPPANTTALATSLFPPSWQHEAFFALSGITATLGVLGCALCSLVLVRGARHVVLSQLLNSLVRADALFCVPMFTRAVAVAWDDWTFGDFICKATTYMYESMLAVRGVLVVALLLWHVVGHRWSTTVWDGIVFSCWLVTMGTGLVVLLDSRVIGTLGSRVCSPHSTALPLPHHMWYVAAIMAPTVVAGLLAPLAYAWRRSRPLDQPHMLQLTLALTVAHLVCETGALVLIWTHATATGRVVHQVMVPLLVSLPLLAPTIDLPCFFWLYPQFRPTIHRLFVSRSV